MILEGGRSETVPRSLPESPSGLFDDQESFRTLDSVDKVCLVDAKVLRKISMTITDQF